MAPQSIIEYNPAACFKLVVVLFAKFLLTILSVTGWLYATGSFIGYNAQYGAGFDRWFALVFFMGILVVPVGIMILWTRSAFVASRPMIADRELIRNVFRVFWNAKTDFNGIAPIEARYKVNILKIPGEKALMSVEITFDVIENYSATYHIRPTSIATIDGSGPHPRELFSKLIFAMTNENVFDQNNSRVEGMLVDHALERKPYSATAIVEDDSYRF